MILTLFTTWLGASVCDDLFMLRADRITAALEAASCYQSQIKTQGQSSDLNTLDALYAQKSLSLAWIILRTKEVPLKRSSIDEGLKLSEQMMSSGLPSADYWRAVFVTFDCQERDGNTVLPRCMFKNLGNLQSLLLSSQKKAPEVHGYGPDRVYGIMYMEMPKVLGGSYAIAHDHLKKAYTLVPSLTMNGIHYAKVLIKLNQIEEAKSVLSKIINLKEEEFDQSTIPETREDQSEARKILGTL